MATLTVVATADSSSQSHVSTVDTNYDNVYLWVLCYTGYTRRSLLRFPLTDLPAGASVSAATLSLYYSAYAASDPVGRECDVYKQTHNDWVETQSTWNSYKTSSAWSVAGGDYVTSGPAGASLNFPASFGWMDFNVLAIVNDAVTNVVDVNVLVKMTIENVGDYEPQFHSSEYAVDTSLRPKLVITYTLAAGPVNLKTVNGLAKASIKVIDGLAIASVKTWDGLT